MIDSYSKKPLKFLKDENKNFKFLLAKIKELESLTESLNSFLEPHLRNHCRVVNRIDHTLVVMVANGSIATSLRFQSTDLIRKFKDHPLLKKIQTIKCKVNPSFTRTELRQAIKPQTKMAHLSSETAKIIQLIADSLEDGKLKEVMQRIAGHSMESDSEGS